MNGIGDAGVLDADDTTLKSKPIVLSHLITSLIIFMTYCSLNWKLKVMDRHDRTGLGEQLLSQLYLGMENSGRPIHMQNLQFLK